MDRFNEEVCTFISLLKTLCDEWDNHQARIIEENECYLPNIDDFDFIFNSDDELDLDDEADFSPEGGEE